MQNQKLTIFDGILLGVAVLVGFLLVLAYLDLQEMLFNSPDYLIFVCPPSTIFLGFICVLPFILGLTGLYLANKYPWQHQRAVSKFLKRMLQILLPVALLLLTIGLFDYAGVKTDGVYFRELPNVFVIKQYNWDDVTRVDVAMHNSLKQGTWFDYVVVFKNENSLNLWQDDLNTTLKIDEILSNKRIPFKVGTLDESDLAPVYQAEIQQIRWLFRQRTNN